jgi:hypothetical protein
MPNPYVIAGIPAVGNLIGGLFGSSGQRDANRRTAELAREQMRFQERMSSTAYQRAAKDLDAAGLNRILALGRPASSPAGAMAQMGNEGAAIQEGLGTGINSAMAATRLRQDIKNLKAQENLTNKQANESITRASLNSVLYNKNLAETNNAKVVNRMLVRDAEISDIDKKLYEKAPILRIIEKIVGSGAIPKWSANSKR